MTISPRQHLILRGFDVGCGDFSLSVYPPSIPVNLELIRNGVQQELLEAGALFKPCFCGPCFGAGDVPANNALSIRHTTRNFPNREGSKPGNGQLAGVMSDGRSLDCRDGKKRRPPHLRLPMLDYDAPEQATRTFDAAVYATAVSTSASAIRSRTRSSSVGPNITEWPKMSSARR